MKRHLYLALLLALVAPAQTACVQYHSKIPGVARPASPDEYEVVGQFNFVIKRRWAFFGLIPVRRPSLESRIRKAVREKGGDGAANLRIYEGMWFSESCLSLFLGFGAANHIAVEGDVIRFKSAASDRP
jgi:hypothetical protein